MDSTRGMKQHSQKRADAGLGNNVRTCLPHLTPYPSHPCQLLCVASHVDSYTLNANQLPPYAGNMAVNPEFHT